MTEVPVGRCIGCFHDFSKGPCGGCGAIQGPDDTYRVGDPAGGPGDAEAGDQPWCPEHGGFQCTHLFKGKKKVDDRGEG